MAMGPIDISVLEKWGEGLVRPEDVAIARDGRVFATDPKVGAREIMSDGTLRSISETELPGCCNGICIDLEGHILIANLGAHYGVPGGLERLDLKTGRREVLLSEVDGRSLTSCNYVLVDAAGNIWCSNSVAASTFHGVAEARPHDGFIFVLRPDGSSSIVAENLGFANGLAMSADGSSLYCCQTFDCNVMRYPVLPGGRLGAGAIFGPQLGPGWRAEKENRRSELHYPDGCAFDVEGNLWVTLFFANKVVAITPAGELVTIIDDPGRTILKSPSNITFGGPDLKDAYIGGLDMNYVVKLRSPVAGMRLAHQL